MKKDNTQVLRNEEIQMLLKKFILKSNMPEEIKQQHINEVKALQVDKA